MPYTINDKNLIHDITISFLTEISNREQEIGKKDFSHPLDEEVRENLSNLILGDKDTIEYSQTKQLDDLWTKLIDKSIQCLRFFDKREPFYDNPNKKPVAYGIEQLEKYHERYAKFEGLLYGASPYYRDHVFHVVRTWMLGIFCLLKKMDEDELLIDQIRIDGWSEKGEFKPNINFFEKISMWTIMALCHDLGYPLEKSQQVLDKTQKMMKDFIANPNIWNNFNFSGNQDSINEYIVKFISTKLILDKGADNLDEKQNQSEKENEQGSNEVYNGRIQPKYYVKYEKSLEHFDHGIISSIIVYKMLLYFLESDFNLNDDYQFQCENARQFYIRREILRAMASHTCSDIYNIYLTTFSSILFLCDEMQEWGRKSWNELYSGLQPNAVKLNVEVINSGKVSIREDINMEYIDEEEMFVESIKGIYERQFKRYKVIFRDGQYTQSKKFNIKKKMNIKLKQEATEDNLVQIEYEIKAQEKNHFLIDLKQSYQYNSKKIKGRLEKTLKTSADDDIDILIAINE